MRWAALSFTHRLSPLRHQYAMSLRRRYENRVDLVLPYYFGPDEYLYGRLCGPSPQGAIALPDKKTVRRQMTLDEFGICKRRRT